MEAPRTIVANALDKTSTSWMAMETNPAYLKFVNTPWTLELEAENPKEESKWTITLTNRAPSGSTDEYKVGYVSEQTLATHVQDLINKHVE